MPSLTFAVVEASGATAVPETPAVAGRRSTVIAELVRFAVSTAYPETSAVVDTRIATCGGLVVPGAPGVPGGGVVAPVGGGGGGPKRIPQPSVPSELRASRPASTKRWAPFRVWFSSCMNSDLLGARQPAGRDVLDPDAVSTRPAS